MIRCLFVVGALLVVLTAGCDDGGGDGGDGSTDDPAAFEVGETVGRIDRFAGGTAVPSDPRTLVALTCEGGRLRAETDVETVTGEMDCDRMLDAAIIANFVGQPVAIRYAEGGRLIIESLRAGTIELPVSDPRLESDDATP
jgi:hypothetical protein